MITRKAAHRLLALPAFFFALIAGGCQTKNNTLGGGGMDAGKSGQKDVATEDTPSVVNACTQAGGSCVGVLPGACASGIVNLSLSCGSGVGTECCLPGGAGGSTGAGGAGGSMGRDAGIDGGNQTLAELCTATGGLVASGLCCASNSGFPEMCQGVGACSCGPTGSKTISVCDCGTGCFSQTLGCVRN